MMHIAIVFLAIIAMAKDSSFAARIPNLYCESDEDCPLMVGESVCGEGNVCACAEHEDYDDMTRKCDKMQRESNRIQLQALQSNPKYEAIQGQPCGNTVDCDWQWGASSLHQCVDGFCHCHGDSDFDPYERRCVCKAKFVVSADNSTCLPVASGLGGNCLEQAQCSNISLSTCVHSVCVCQDNCHMWKNACHHNKMIGGGCDRDSECSSIEHAACQDHVCACPIGYVISHNADVCFHVGRQRSQGCTEDSHCFENLALQTSAAIYLTSSHHLAALAATSLLGLILK